jgi:integrase/recombinase XerD
MTPLRRRMIDDMTLRNFTKTTIRAYVQCVARFALRFHTSPDLLGPEHVRDYLLHLLQERHVSMSHYNQTRCALRFFYRETLGRDDVPASLRPAKQPHPTDLHDFLYGPCVDSCDFFRLASISF